MKLRALSHLSLTADRRTIVRRSDNGAGFDFVRGGTIVESDALPYDYDPALFAVVEDIADEATTTEPTTADAPMFEDGASVASSSIDDDTQDWSAD